MGRHLVVDVGEQFPPVGFQSFLGASKSRHHETLTLLFPGFLLKKQQTKNI